MDEIPSYDLCVFCDGLLRKPKFGEAFYYVIDFITHIYRCEDVGVVTGVAAGVVPACAHDLGSHVSAWSFPDLLNSISFTLLRSVHVLWFSFIV